MLFNSDRHENDAEHSWHLALMAIVLCEHSNEPIDLLKVVKMLLIHDIVEIDAGDIFLYDSVTSHTNTVAETKAAERIFGLLPKDQSEEKLTSGRNSKLEKLMKLNLRGRWTVLSRYYKMYPITAVPGKSSE